MTLSNRLKFAFSYALLAVVLLASASATAIAQEPDKKPWKVIIGSWNLQNFGDKKSGIAGNEPKDELLRKIADIAKNHHIIFFQEVQGSGRSITDPDRGLRAYMPEDWVCAWVSERSNARGNRERFSYCLSPTPTYEGGGPVVVQPSPVKIDFLIGGDRMALDGTLSDPQDIWARPPSLVTIEVPRPDDPNLIIDIYDNHLRPRYGPQSCCRPPGVDVAASRYQSVANELLSLEGNLVPGDGGVLVLGDLNADCKYYAKIHRDGKFTSDDWTWWIDYGVRTNAVAKKASCAYDRFIGNAEVAEHYLWHGIHSIGINQFHNGYRVSDHYKISLTLGHENEGQPLPALVAVSTAESESTNIKKRKQISDNAASGGGGKKRKITVNATNLNGKVAPGTSTKLYIVAYDQNIHYGGLVDIPLKDIEDNPITLKVDSDGTLSDDLNWDDPDPGAYKMVLDVNADGTLNVYKGDIVNSDSEIDILVHPADFHSDVVTLGDNGLLREVFFEDKARNIYGLAKELPRNEDVIGYVISHKLFSREFESWDDYREKKVDFDSHITFSNHWSSREAYEHAKERLHLENYAVPVNIIYGPVYRGRLKLADKQLPLATDNNGRLFATIWKEPSVLFNLRVLGRRIARLPLDPDNVPGTCEEAWESDNPDLHRLCNVGNSFSDYYGTRFNFVIVFDKHEDGKVVQDFLVDTYSIKNLQGFFDYPSNQELGPGGGKSPAIQEYQDFLSARLNLVPPLSQDHGFDQETENASRRYLGQVNLSRHDFSKRVKVDAQIGFHVIDRDTFEQSHAFESGFFKFDHYYNGNEILIEDEDEDEDEASVDEASVVVETCNAQLAARIKAPDGGSLRVSARNSAIMTDGFVADSSGNVHVILEANPAAASRSGQGC